MKTKFLLTTLLVGSLLFSCAPKKEDAQNPIKAKVEQFAEVKLTTDCKVLSPNQKKMIPLLIEAAKLMEEIYWEQAYGCKEEAMDLAKDKWSKKFVKINYGPWDRLDGNKPFIKGVKPKALGSNFYPKDMTEEEFKALKDDSKKSLYTMIKRDKDGKLIAVPYHKEFAPMVKKASELIKKASELAEDPGFKKYLALRAEAITKDDYLASDMAWMDMQTNIIDFIAGPIETYEDGLYGIKTGNEAFILVKDMEWSKKLDKFKSLLPKLQNVLPAPKKYLTEVPGSGSDLGVYDALYYAGDCNAGSKTIAINLPNDEKVQNEKGSRKLQLKNVMKAKFNKIVTPISKIVIDKSQRKHVKFDAFFNNTMFHEVAHGLGLNYTLDGKTTVTEALNKYATAIEEGKADIGGLYIITKLSEWGELKGVDLMDNYVTYVAGIFRSCRFGAASSHGKANMISFNFFKNKGAFVRNEKTGTYKVNFEKMKTAIKDLVNYILIMQGDGNIVEAKKAIKENGVIPVQLQADLDKINSAGIPKDIIFKQGVDCLNLK